MSNLTATIRKSISPYYRHLEMRIKTVWYNRYLKKSIVHRISTQPKVRVAFMTVNLSMWKCEKLFRLMMSDDRFDPVIVPIPRPMFNQESERQEQIRMADYCEKMGFPYIPGYDYEKKAFNGYDEIKPDMVFYSQPYNASFPAHKLEAFWKHCLFYYVPYCFVIENMTDLLDTLYMNICQNVFLESGTISKIESTMTANKGRNFTVSGYMGAASLNGFNAADSQLWKNGSDNMKKVIWAPHFSILDTDKLNYSNFLAIAWDMLELARKYDGQVQFSFKPHPGLKARLYNHPDWGIEKTDRYYSEWNDMPNAVLSEGLYDGLFRSSDAMIHDSSSFTVEYLYTGKPVMYIAKSDHMDYMNSFGASCFNVHYKGTDINDIKLFIDNVVIGGNDTMKAERTDFVRKNLMNADDNLPEDNILNLLAEAFNTHRGMLRKTDKYL